MADYWDRLDEYNEKRHQRKLEYLEKKHEYEMERLEKEVELFKLKSKIKSGTQEEEGK